MTETPHAYFHFIVLTNLKKKKSHFSSLSVNWEKKAERLGGKVGNMYLNISSWD